MAFEDEFAAISKRLDGEEHTHQYIIDRLEALSASVDANEIRQQTAITEIKLELEHIKERQAPIAAAWQDIAAAARVGRMFRAVLIWMAGLVGAGAFLYATGKGWFK